MLHKVLAVFGILALVSCNPSYAAEQPLEMTATNCTKVKTMARQIVIDLQQGASQYQVMRSLNARPMGDYGTNGEIVKLYLQVNTSALTRNVFKGYRLGEILKVVEKDCLAQVKT